ncbi:MAG: M60 family metallopeptidase [Bacteroidaceae bacterium]|nr:M60 family metallopeptidase [Bacteroidaceae bacterium]
MKKAISFFVILLCPLILRAALTSGVYKVQNVSYGRYMYEDFSSGGISTSTSYADGDYEKLWKVTVNGTNVTLQNIYTGHYAQTQTTTSAQFMCGANATSFALTTNADGSYMFKSGSYMHCAATQSYYVVNWWDSNSTPSMWNLEPVNLTDAEIASIREAFASVDDMNNNATAYNTQLALFFNDLSCSELKASYRNYSDAQLRSAMNEKGIPVALQEMGVKVKNGWADEIAPSFSAQFRVREYTPYSRADYWRNRLKATQFNDMSNPTGIYASSKDVLYVFVGEDIPANCSLRIVGLSGVEQANYSAGHVLKKGLNAIQASADRQHFWIMYTYTGNGTMDLASLPPLKIHIEGGEVAGFVDVTALDESSANALYKSVLSNANSVASTKGWDASETAFVVKGNYGVFDFMLDSYNKIWASTAYNNSYTPNYQIYKSIHWYDNVLMWEWSMMGFMKRVAEGDVGEHEHVSGGSAIYPVYCNNLALTIQGASNNNPFSTTGYTCMPGVWGIESSYNGERADFDNWCAGHESGHNNQGAINLQSCTESSNNLFSGIVTYLYGYRMSRGNTISYCASDFLSGKPFGLRDIASTHRMYYQLYLYYHVAEHKTDFYPTLFTLLRDDPMNLDSGVNSLLKFVRKCCAAANEDLTDFFQAWGFFEPLDNVTFGDYTNHTISLSQSEIDACKAEIASTYNKKNSEILFIEDRIEESYRWDPWASGNNDPRVVHGTPRSACGDLGSVNDYKVNSSTAVNPTYSSYSLSGTTLTMNGTGGVGFLVYDGSGKLVAFSNCLSFDLNASTIAEGGFSVVSISADGKKSEVKNVTEVGTDEEKLAALQSVLAKAQTYVDKKDETNTKVGFYKASALESLEEQMARAQEVIATNEASLYGSLMDSLNQSLSNIDLSTQSKVQIIPGNYYSLRNALYPNRYASINGQALTTTTSTFCSDSEKWQFVKAGEEGKYHILNKKAGTFISTLGTSTQATASATSPDEAFAFTLDDYGEGMWALNSHSSSGYTYLHSAANDSYKIVGWTGDANASHWYLTLVEESEEREITSRLAGLILKSQELLNTICSSWSAEATPCNLQTTSPSSDGYIWTNAQESSEGNIANLIDGNISTFFHSAWNNGPDEDHFLQVDLHEAVDLFSFHFTNRYNSVYTSNSGFESPTFISVTGSNDGVNFLPITTLTTDDGLPYATGGQSSYESAVLGMCGEKYLHIRFTVLATNTQKTSNGHIFFALGEFGFESRDFSYSLLPRYSSANETLVKSLMSELTRASIVLASGTTQRIASETEILQGYFDALMAWAEAPFVRGDVNLDGEVNVSDVTALVSIILESTSSSQSIENADINEDGAVNVSDVTALVSIILQK